MKRIVIIGAGGFGREMLAWLKSSTMGEFEIVGFLDQNKDALAGYAVGYPIIGDPESYKPEKEDHFVCALGNPKIKLRIARSIQKRGGAFFTFIHGTATIGNEVKIGEGCILCPGVVVSSDVQLGAFVTLNVYATVGHDAVIGDGCTLSAHADVTGYATLGEGVFMGTHAAVLPRAAVGDYAVVGAGSVVLKKVKPHSTVIGVPAKQIIGFD